MVDIVTRVNNVVNGFVWGPFGLALLLCTGLWLSVRTGFFQFLHISAQRRIIGRQHTRGNLNHNLYSFLL